MNSDEADALKRVYKLSQTKLALSLELFRELVFIEKRLVISEIGHTSLYYFLVDELQLNQQESYRLVQSLQLIRLHSTELEWLDKGGHSIESLSLIRKYFRQNHELCFEEQCEFLKSCRFKKIYEIEKIMAQRSSFDRIWRVELKQKTIKELTRLKGLRGVEQGIDELLDWMVKSSEKLLFKERFSGTIRRKVFERDKGRCVKCQSQVDLEIDHLYPKAAGGSDDIENLRLLCRRCNQRAAISFFNSA